MARPEPVGLASTRVIAGTTPRDGRPRRAGLAEAVIAWLVIAVVTVEIFITYTRTPVQELYRVRNGGLREGVGRAIAFVGFPGGLVALAVLGLIAGRLSQRRVAIGGVAAALILAAILSPGAFEEAGLETPAARLTALIGVLLTLGLTVAAVSEHGAGRLGRERGDIGRVVIGAIVLFAALPWMAADLGLSLDRIPGLGTVFQTDLLARQPSRPGLHPSVHDGHHHGMDGALLALLALLLSRALGFVRSRRLRRVTGTYIVFLFVYGLANAFQDFWLEQIVKRGWSTYEFPMMLKPSAGLAWVVIPAATAVLAGVAARCGLFDCSARQA